MVGACLFDGFGLGLFDERRIVQPPGERITFLTDPEVAATRVAFWFPRTPNAVKTGADFRRRLVERMGRIILHDRLEREAERAGSPLLSAGVSLRQPVRPVEAHVVGAVVADRRTAEGLATIAGVIGRLRRFGPRPSELAHARENLLDERREALSGVESADIAEMEIGVKALGTHPLKTEKLGLGSHNVPVRFAGVDFIPGHYLYADEDGLLVSEKALELPE